MITLANSVLSVAGNAAADSQAKNPNGALGLLVFLVLAVVVVFLFRSMNGHLRKVRRMEAEERAAKADAAKLTKPGKPHAG